MITAGSKRSNIKRAAALLLAFAVALSASACGSGSEESPADVSSQTEITETSEEQSSETEPTDFFGEDYDPLSDDYDPYGNGGALTEVSNSPQLINAGDSSDETDETEKADETEKSEEQSEAAVTAAETKPAETKPAKETAAAVTVTEKRTEEKNTASETSKAKEEKPMKSDTKDVSLTVSVPNGWSDGTNDFSQVDGSVKNNSSSNVDGWTATIKAASGTSLEQSWNCDIKIDGGTLTVTPVEHNRSIAPGGEGTFGFILKNPGEIDPAEASVVCTMGAAAASAGGNGGSNGSAPPAPVQAKDVPAPTTDDWLSVKGNKIVDKNGREVWLTGINWFGYNTGTNTFDGLWTCDLNTSVAAIADRGFNLLRVPISAELINQWSSGNYPRANFNQATNSYLVGMTSLEIFDYVIGQCRANGIKIMIDIHSAKTDSMGHMKNVWYDGNITEQDYLDALSWIAERYKNDDTIIAYDLKNEPHGKANENPRAKWDSSSDPDNWRYIAEKAAMAVLSKNPNALVMVEGIEIYPRDIKKNGDFSSTNAGDYYSTWWGGNLRGVRDNPVDLGKYQNKLVYSPHDYGPTVYEQEWFKGDYTYQSLYDDVWYDNWFYIQDKGTAPLLIGEWGGFMRQPNLKWMTYLRQLISEKKIHHTFWCFNANSGDTGGLVKDDFTTWDEEKYEFVKEVLWQEDGKFVGLDHEIPLGKNGKTLS